MAGRLRLSHSPSQGQGQGPSLGRLAWPLMALALAAACAAAWALMGPDGAPRWGWRAAPQPGAEAIWRWWTAALVHLSSAHLEANLWACAVVAAWGWAARLGSAQALAWLLAWPLSQALLVTDPGTLHRYAGLSATLHAGAAIGCWHLLWHTRGARRAVGIAVSVAIGIKLMLEVPVLQALWSGVGAGADHWTAEPLPQAPGHVVAGHAHGCGVLAGVLAAALVDGIIALTRSRRLPPSPPTPTVDPP